MTYFNNIDDIKQQLVIERQMLYQQEESLKREHEKLTKLIDFITNTIQKQE